MGRKYPPGAVRSTEELETVAKMLPTEYAALYRKCPPEVALSTKEINHLETVARMLPTEYAVLYLQRATGLSEYSIRKWVGSLRRHP